MPIVVGVEMGGKLGTPQIKSDESSERFKRIDDPATFEELIDLQRNRINKYGNKNYLLVMGNLQQISEVPFKGWSFYLEDRRNNPNAHVWGNFMTSYADKDSYISYANMNFKKSTEGYLMNGGNGDIRAKLTDQISNPNTSSKLGLIAAPEYWLE